MENYTQENGRQVKLRLAPYNNFPFKYLFLKSGYDLAVV